MITITPEAAKQIRHSAETTNSQGLYLRIAARREDDGAYVYGMGFDEMDEDDTLLAASEGVHVLVANPIGDFFMGATLDFVEIGPGERQFIFINTNDPAHAAASVSGKNPPDGI